MLRRLDHQAWWRTQPVWCNERRRFLFDDVFGTGRDGGNLIRVRNALASIHVAAKNVFQTHEALRLKRAEYSTQVEGLDLKDNILAKSLAVAIKRLVVDEAKPLAKARQQAIEKLTFEEQAARELGVSESEIRYAREAGKSEGRRELGRD
jgi:hypothetical protein